MARNWRTARDLQRLSAESRLRQPALTSIIESQRGVLAQPVLDLVDRYELQAASPNPTQLSCEGLTRKVALVVKPTELADGALAQAVESALDSALPPRAPVGLNRLESALDVFEPRRASIRAA